MTIAKKSTNKTWSAVDDGGDDDKPKSHGGMCAAHGCPLIGSVSPHMAGSGWVCYPHLSVSSANWQEVTKRLNQMPQHVDLVTMLRKAMNGQAIELRPVLQDITQRGFNELLPLPEELRFKQGMSLWHKRLSKLLTDRATDGLVDIVVTESGTPSRSSDKLMALVGDFMAKNNLGGVAA